MGRHWYEAGKLEHKKNTFTDFIACAEHLIEDKFGRQRTWAGNAYYTLKKTDDGFQLHEKIVRLLNSDGMLNSFSYLF